MLHVCLLDKVEYRVNILLGEHRVQALHEAVRGRVRDAVDERLVQELQLGVGDIEVVEILRQTQSRSTPKLLCGAGVKLGHLNKYGGDIAPVQLLGSEDEGRVLDELDVEDLVHDDGSDHDAEVGPELGNVNQQVVGNLQHSLDTVQELFPRQRFVLQQVSEQSARVHPILLLLLDDHVEDELDEEVDGVGVEDLADAGEGLCQVHVVEELLQQGPGLALKLISVNVR